MGQTQEIKFFESMSPHSVTDDSDPIVLNTVQPQMETKWDKRQTHHSSPKQTI